MNKQINVFIYYIGYRGQDEISNNGVVNLPRPIESLDDITAIEETIKEQKHMDRVLLTNFVYL